MRRKIAWMLLAGLVSTAMSVGAESPSTPTLLSKSAAVRLEIVLGRITAIPLHAGQLRVSTPESQAVRECLVVNNGTQAPHVRYERSDGRECFIAEIVHHSHVTLRRESLEGKETRVVEYRQPKRGNVELVVARGDHRQTVQNRSIWHLMLSDREVCERELIPLLECLRPDWRISTMAGQLESRLFQMAVSEPTISRSFVINLIKQLDSPQFRQRQAADNELRSLGPAVLPLLDSLDNTSLTREQWVRVQHVREMIAGTSIDSYERTAAWLSDDERVWFALLRHSDPQRRHLAAIRLTSMRSHSLDFDPYADESYRQEQLAQLESRFSRR